jgi:hypothetical protein
MSWQTNLVHFSMHICLLLMFKGTFTKIGAIGTVSNVFVSKFILILNIFLICFDNNVYNISWKHVQLFEMNLMKFEFSKTLINQCNQCFTMFLLLEKTHK